MLVNWSQCSLLLRETLGIKFHRYQEPKILYPFVSNAVDDPLNWATQGGSGLGAQAGLYANQYSAVRHNRSVVPEAGIKGRDK